MQQQVKVSLTSSQLAVVQEVQREQVLQVSAALQLQPLPCELQIESIHHNARRGEAFAAAAIAAPVVGMTSPPMFRIDTDSAVR